MTARQRREFERRAAELAEFIIALNESNPLPPDVHHRALEQAAKELLELMATPVRLMRRRR